MSENSSLLSKKNDFLLGKATLYEEGLLCVFPEVEN